MGKISDASNAKESYKSFLKKKQKILVERSNIFTQQLKALENSKIIDIKSVSMEHPQTSSKLSTTIKQAEKVSQVRGANKTLLAICIVIQQKVIFIYETNTIKDAKITCFLRLCKYLKIYRKC